MIGRCQLFLRVFVPAVALGLATAGCLKSAPIKFSCEFAPISGAPDVVVLNSYQEAKTIKFQGVLTSSQSDVQMKNVDGSISWMEKGVPKHTKAMGTIWLDRTAHVDGMFVFAMSPSENPDLHIATLETGGQLGPSKVATISEGKLGRKYPQSYACKFARDGKQTTSLTESAK